MTVKEILKLSASMIGREDVVNYLDGDTTNMGEDTFPTVNVLVTLLNLVVSELSGTFIPMVKSERVQTLSGKVYYANLSERCIRVRGVYTVDGKKIDYKYTPEYMLVYSENAVVEYEYAPSNYGLTDTLGYTEKDVSTAMLCYGLLAEYAITKGSFDEAVMWHDRYVDAITEKRKMRNGEIKPRSFYD